MKCIKVVIETLLQVPDHTEILSHPQDEVQCLKLAGQYYMPAVQWSKRDPDGTWVGDDDAFDELWGREGTEVASIETIPEEEFRRAFGESEGEGGNQEGRSECDAP